MNEYWFDIKDEPINDKLNRKRDDKPTNFKVKLTQKL